ncbi:MAG: SDR family oxidoreductase [Spirochaetales bacterium]|nr:SDR family oxidoreductase [Spirochaetales bacterium]
MKNCPYPKTVLVTGASSGIGKETADLFAMNGFTVYAASRHPLETKNKSIIPVQMDVTDLESVRRAAEKIDSLGIIINCAGFGISGSAEMTPSDRAHAQMETNYFGVLNVNSVFLPKLRQNPRSLVLITSSVAGLVPIPYQSHYSSSKYALEAYAQALRIEAGQFGVKVCLVEPGDTKTGFTKARSNDEPEDSPYYKECRAAVEQMAHDEQTGKPADSVAKVFLKIAFRSNPPVRCAVGFGYKALALLSRLLPARMVNWIIKLIYIG